MFKYLDNDIRFLKNLADKKGYKPLWVVSELYKKYGAKVVSNRKTIQLISIIIGESGKKIKWFIKDVLDTQ